MSSVALSRQIIDLLASGLDAAFDALSTQRYGAPLTLRHLPTPHATAPSISLRLERDNQLAGTAILHVRHAGGNMYDVDAQIENGPTQSFAYCLPDPMPLIGTKSPHVVQRLAAFLLDALERQLGSAFLRRELHRASASPGSDLESPRSREHR